jgi:gamma-glutamyltranspeptidase / glutathione hydrolase
MSSISYANGGMVASASRRAAQAGLEILRSGGNAFDAAIAVAGVEWSTLPGMCGLGGDVFAVLYDACEDRVVGINGSGVVGSRVDRAYYTDQGLDKMPLAGWHAAAVPGAAHAYATIADTFGTRSLSDLLTRSLDYAENGIVVSQEMSDSISSATSKLSDFEDSAKDYLPGGHPPRPGDVWKRPRLARTIRTYTQGGPDAFYKGPIAEEIVRASIAADGPFGLEEFAAHSTDIYVPPSVNYRGVDVYETAPPSQGLIVLQWLNLLEGFDLSGMGFGSADALHTLVETKKLAFADRLAYLADPQFVDVPMEQLLSKSFADQRRNTIDPNRSNDDPIAGDLSDGNTSSFCVVDGQGNAISFIHSLSAGFGSGVVAGDTGVILNNRSGRGFSLVEGHPNVLEPGKKTMHTLNCYLLARDGKLMGVGGTPGGDRQPQWNVQTITNLIDFGMSPQDAVDAPSWVSWPGTDPAEIDTPLELRLEDTFPSDIREALAARGHRIASLGNNAGSRIQLITRDSNGILRGATDPRYTGIALGY